MRVGGPSPAGCSDRLRNGSTYRGPDQGGPFAERGPANRLPRPSGKSGELFPAVVGLRIPQTDPERAGLTDPPVSIHFRVGLVGEIVRPPQFNP